MPQDSDLLNLVRFFSIKKNTPIIYLQIFLDYLQKYSRHHLPQRPELIEYVDISQDRLINLLRNLEDDGFISIITDPKNDVLISSPYFYIEKVKNTFRDIEVRPDVPFPLETELPKNFPAIFTKKMRFSEDFIDFSPENKEHEFLFVLNFGGLAKTLLLPSSYSSDKLMELAMLKLKLMLDKDDARDYLQKRLLIANPSKETSVRNFVSKIQSRGLDLIRTIKEAGDTYIFWGQLCVFIRQEFAKKNEKLPDEESLLQSICVLEYLVSYYRGKAQKALQAETALKNLNLALQKQPFYYTMTAISGFTDSRGIPLLGQYTEEDLQEFMKEKTSTSQKFSVPDILTFQNSIEERFYVLAEKVIPLLLSLISEYRPIIKDICVEKWKKQIREFNQDAPMKDNNAFNKFIRELCESEAMNLYALLNSAFMPSLIADKKINELQAMEIGRLFPHGKMASYANILMLNRTEILNDVKILLPFWYTIPVISWIISLFKKPRKRKNAKSQDKESVSAKNKTVTFKQAAADLRSKILPEDVSLDAAMQKYLDSWNHILDETHRNNLTEDINSLVRDYIRGIQKTLNPSGLTEEKLSRLAAPLIDIKSLSKIKNKTALKSYIELYILKIIESYF